LEEIWTSLGRQPRYHELSKGRNSAYSKGTYAERFGSWRKALEAFISYISGDESAAADEIENLKVESLPKRKTPRTIKVEEASLSGKSAENGQQGPRNINWRLRFIVMRRDNFKCRACGRSPATDPSVILHADHVEPWSKNGRTVVENLQTLCSICNIGKSNLDFQEVR
jgi:predicted restriction endonuclease